MMLLFTKIQHVRGVCLRGSMIVLEQKRFIAAGKSLEVFDDPQVLAMYFWTGKTFEIACEKSATLKELGWCYWPIAA